MFRYYKYVDRYRYTILLTLFFLWICVGVFPLVCYESDSIEVIMGCDILYYQGWSFPPVLCYEYRMQPLTVIMVVALKHLLPFFTCEQIYCLITAISSFIFIVGSIEFGRFVTGSERFIVLLAAILLPEMYAIAMYPNSAIPAAACFIWALLFIIYKKYLLSIILMCIAPLFRVDVVIVYSAILPLFFFVGFSLKKSLVYSICYGLIVVIISLSLFGLFKADVLSAFSGYETWNNKIKTTQVLIAIFGFYSLSYFMLLPLGLYAIIKKKIWKELFLILVPVLILHFIYRSMGCASKHYLYIAPFVIIAGVRALSFLLNIFKHKNYYIKQMSVISILLFYILSIRIIPPSRPWFGIEKNKEYNAGVLTSICSTTLLSTKVSLGIGAGQLVRTFDEAMLATGQLFYSLYMHSLKKHISSVRCKQMNILDSIPSSEILLFTWGGRAPMISMCLAKHYQIKIDKNIICVFNNQKSLHFSVHEIEAEDKESVLKKTLKTYSSPLETNDILMIAGTPRLDYYLDNLSKTESVEKITDMFYKFRK